MIQLNRPKILVTGGAGYIGSHTVVELYHLGYEPVIADNFSNAQPWIIDQLRKLTSEDLKFYEADVTDRRQLARIVEQEGQFLGIIHFAAFKAVGESFEKEAQYRFNNLSSLKQVIDLKKQFNIPDLVFSSSATVYGEPEILPVTEEHPMGEAFSPYGATKQEGEEMIRQALPTGAAILRYFNPIGAHPSGMIGELPQGVPSNLLPFITQTAAGIRPKLSVFGDDYPTPDGTAIRDYIHVVDLAKAHVAALQHLSFDRKTDVFNIGTGNGTSVLELIRAFEHENVLEIPFEVVDRRAGDIPAIHANVDKAEHLLGWSARYSIRDAVRHAWRWEQRIHQYAKAA